MYLKKSIQVVEFLGFYYSEQVIYYGHPQRDLKTLHTLSSYCWHLSYLLSSHWKSPDSRAYNMIQQDHHSHQEEE